MYIHRWSNYIVLVIYLLTYLLTYLHRGYIERMLCCRTTRAKPYRSRSTTQRPATNFSGNLLFLRTLGVAACGCYGCSFMSGALKVHSEALISITQQRVLRIFRKFNISGNVRKY